MARHDSIAESDVPDDLEATLTAAIVADAEAMGVDDDPGRSVDEMLATADDAVKAALVEASAEREHRLYEQDEVCSSSAGFAALTEQTLHLIVSELPEGFFDLDPNDPVDSRTL